MVPRDKAEQLRKLHAGPELLVIPNAWDAVSARMVEAEGFPVVATTSAGCAAVMGYQDGQRIPRFDMLHLIGRIAAAVSIPVTADVEAGYDDPAETVRELIGRGVAGLNLEDMIEGELLPLEEQIYTIREMRETAAEFGVPIVLNARTDIFLAKEGEEETRFDRAVERLNAFHEAGADCLFAPGVADAETIGRLVGAVKGPLNILATVGTPPLEELKKLGVRRVSMGSGPSRVALGAFRKLLRSLDFELFKTEAVPFAEVQELLARD
jgi:2-methylisocitrate lyase-like PEP mutase family enzyme